MKKRINKSFDRDFLPSKKSTFCYVHIDNIEVKVNITRDTDKINLNFSFKGKLYKSEEIILEDINDYITLDTTRIKFNGIKLNDVDLINLARCIDKMIDIIEN